ncbi:solute carrier family 22 member 7-like, partial [Actinia tenebrosa]|uniref:Solute carrier family 22 member 7-like n=1 Tax=Actinia tenebrosa TaxID=6105 RepID=A0A6P8I011_ACTTE
MAILSEEAIEKIGSFGRLQIRILLIISYSILFSTCVLMVMTFITAEPPWRCAANSTSCTMNGTFKVGDNHYEKRCGIPRKDWEFAAEGDFDSIVTEWDLVCKKASLASLANSLLFIVWLFASLLSSVLSDKYGRKAVIFPCSVFTCICALASAFAQRYWVFALFRALAGVGIGGYLAPSFVLVTEYVGVRHRGAVGFGIWFAWVLALMLLSLLGYLIHSWRFLTVIISAPGMLYFLFWWATPESLRWLLTKGKMKDAQKTFKTAARVNRVNLEHDELSVLKFC